MNDSFNLQAVKHTMSCKTIDLLEALKFLQKTVPKTNRGKRYMCEITIKTNEVLLVVIGATRVIFCKATGPVKVTIPILYIYDIVRNIHTPYTQISVGDGFLTIGNVTVNANTFFFHDDSILRSISLAINYTVGDILRLKDQYTAEELQFNNLTDLVKITNEGLISDIDYVSGVLRKYGFTYREIENMVNDKIFNKKFNPKEL